jgi:ligand-binding sensor domain-containing protein/anti-sigma regulatory factor (Ser/Thr protein kinase)
LSGTVPRNVRRTLTLLAAVAVFSAGRPAAALDPHRALTQALLRKWQAPQGLPQPAILSIRQTSDAYIWLGTQSGLFRFDGVRFVAPPHGDGINPLEGIWVQDLCEDREHRLWIATSDAGVIRPGHGAFERFGRDEGLPSLNVHRLLVDQQGTLWAGTEDGLARWTGTGFETCRAGQGRAANRVQALCQTADGRIWIGTEDGALDVWDGERFSPRPLQSLPEPAPIRTLLESDEGVVWVGTTSGLIRVEGDSERRITRSDGLADDGVECLARSRNGVLWVGTKDGLSRLRDRQGEEIESFRARDGLSQSTVFALWEDHEGSLWVGTKHGLNQFVDRRTIPLTVSEGLPDNDTGALLEDSAGTVWIGTLGKGLARYDGRRCSIAVTSGEGLPSDTVRTLAEGTNGDLWIGTDRGVCQLRGTRVVRNYTTEDGLPSNDITCLGRDARGTLWAGTAAGLAEFVDGEFLVPEGDAAARRLPIAALIDDGAGGLLVSTEGGGLFRCTDRRIDAALANARAPALPDVDAFFRDRDGVLWMGTRQSGLGMTAAGKTVRFTAKDGLYDDDIFGIVADDTDRLWMACSRGIFFVRRSDLRRFAAGETARVTSTPFSPTDALRTIECQSGVQPVVWKMHDGRIWFSTVHGVIMIDPAHVERRLPPPSVHVEEVQINGQAVDPGNIPPLPPGRTNCSFRYTALSFASPLRVAFRYKLDGFDKDWITAGSRREAFYTNLPPGSYRFRVGAANPGEVWTEPVRPVEFTLRPHFYQRPWFLPLAVALTILAGGLAFRLRVLQVREKLGAVLAERSRIARELHDTLIQGFSGVTMQMQALAARLRPSPERTTLDEIIEDAGQCLREARRSVGGLRHAPGRQQGLAEALTRSARQLTETRDVRLRLEIAECPGDIPVDVEYNLLRIAQEAISNAVKHAAARSIDVALLAPPEELSLAVRDDGRGFSVDDPANAHGHYGLIGMRERASQIHADLRIESAPGQGTTVQLRLALNRAAGPSIAAPAIGQPPAVEEVLP